MPTPNDPWSVDDEKRIFLAPGIFSEENSLRMGASEAFWNSLPKSAQERILRDMERLDMRDLRWEGNIVSMTQRPRLSDLDDPGAYIKDCADLLRFFIEAAKKPALLAMRLSIRLSHKSFMLVANHSACVCG